MMMNEKTNSGQSNEVREQVVEYEVRRKDSVQWKYDPRQLIPFEQIEAVAKRIAEKFPVEKILLFGSYAYGEPEEGSDVDLLVVMETDKRPIQHTLDITRSLSPLRFSVDIIVRSEKEIQRRISQGDWMLRDAYEKGRLLYAR
ncbi:MAG: nucleotidyltransferase domain-containing protein [Bacteroidota bacterium]|jgi:predicted nucleotidyltransferase